MASFVSTGIYMSGLRNSIFGTLVLKTGIVTKEQVFDCLNEQKIALGKGKKPRRLGEIMAHKGYLTVEQVNIILQKQKDEANKNIEKINDLKVLSEIKSGDSFGVYKVLHKLGVDANGATFKAKNNTNGMLVSLRILSRESMRDKGYLKLFESHAKKASKLDHPNIVKIITAGSVNGRLYYTSEYIEGVSVRRLLEGDKLINAKLVVEIGIAVLDALEYAHKKEIFHRHLSPSCIIILPDKSIKVSGFGAVPKPIENLAELTRNTDDTPFYIAPEQAGDDGNSCFDARTDIYSLGSILYHAFAGKPPYSGSSVEEVLLQIVA